MEMEVIGLQVLLDISNLRATLSEQFAEIKTVKIAVMFNIMIHQVREHGVTYFLLELKFFQ